jgi:hypothetical protein
MGEFHHLMTTPHPSRVRGTEEKVNEESNRTSQGRQVPLTDRGGSTWTHDTRMFQSTPLAPASYGVRILRKRCAAIRSPTSAMTTKYPARNTIIQSNCPRERPRRSEAD